MIVAPAPDADSLLLTTQNDHAHLSGEILSLWRADGLPELPRRAALLFAAREHDNGWREVDSAPYVDPLTGKPHDFLTLPRELRFEIWRRGTARYRESHPYAALLITQHALYLHQDRQEEEGFAEFLSGLEERFAELLEETGAARETVETDYRFLYVTDLMSLVAASRWTDDFERRGTRMRLEGDTLLLDPFPLAGSTSFSLRCRQIPDRHYRSDSDLALELARARWIARQIRLVPMG